MMTRKFATFIPVSLSYFQLPLKLYFCSPILSRGIRKCFLPGSSTTSVNLLLPEWADNIHPTQKNDAVMDPWLNIVTETQFLESITAKIVSNV